MKKPINLLSFFLINISLWAQSPQKMSYQAVIYNSNNQLVTNQQINMRISILQWSVSGSAIYVETHTPTTNSNGLISLEIGGGTVVSGSISSIDWAKGPYFLKNETDLNGGTNYNIIGASQLLNVPYAFYAEKAGNVYSHYVGELYGGGMVFWIDETGQHGLIVSLTDLGICDWWTNPYVNIPSTNANRDGYYAGKTNTERIIAYPYHDNSNYAAMLCSEYKGGGFGDWYLPAISELKLLGEGVYHTNMRLQNIGGIPFNPNYYWSSTEFDYQGAWCYDFGNSQSIGVDKTFFNNIHVRAVRAF